jgi:glycosyltransferase involved in cell wall biosynthesis
MKLLIITQAVDKNHSALGFFHRWVEEFAKNCEQVQVIALEVGEYNFPNNVTVHSLGKDSGGGKISYLINFYKLIWQLRKQYDSVFVHMNQIYVILGAPLWKLFNKKVGFWYVHKQVTLSLRMATVLVNKIFTSSPESFQIRTNKVEYIGHGIDFAFYKTKQKERDENKFNISHFGRITEIKNINTLIKAVSLTRNRDKIVINLYGEPNTPADSIYQKELVLLKDKLNLPVNFCGAVTSSQIPELLSSTDISINLTPTGGWDKVVLEAIASKTPVLTSNQAFANLFGRYRKSLIFEFNDENELANKIDEQISISSLEKNEQIETIYKKSSAYDLKNLIPRLIDFS